MLISSCHQKKLERKVNESCEDGMRERRGRRGRNTFGELERVGRKNNTRRIHRTVDSYCEVLNHAY